MRATIAALTVCLLLASTAGPALLAAPNSATGAAAEADAGDVAGLGPASLATAPAVGQGSSDGATAGPVQERQSGLEAVERVDVQVRADGDARFALVLEFPAETEAETAAFERTAQDFRSGDLPLGLPFFQTVVEDVDAATERDMALVATDRRTPVDDGTGRLVQEFTWTNFAVTEEDRVELGDAFQTEDGLWLQSLEDGQEFVVHAPEGYGVAHSEPKSSVRGSTVIWQGPETFQEGDFRTVFEQSANGFDAAWIPAAGVAAVLVVLAVVFLFLLRGSDPRLRGDVVNRITAAIPGGAGSASTEGTSSATDDQPSADGSGETTTAATGDADEADDEVDPELLSDEERVERLLEQNGGRMKQARIVDETGWSNAKVSQLLSEMAEQGRVDKLRIGRENLISLPDEDVTATE